MWADRRTKGEQKRKGEQEVHPTKGVHAFGAEFCFLEQILYNVDMKKRQIGFCKESEWFYRVYARENQVDYLQLCLLDLLRQANGSLTWMAIDQQIPYSRQIIRQTVQDLEQDELVTTTPDGVFLTDLAEFTVDEILDDLHHKLDAAFALMDDSTPNLMA